MLSESMKHKTTFDKYLHWWNDTVQRVVVDQITELKENLIEVKLMYNLKSGQQICSVDIFSLERNNSKWLINDQKSTKCVQ